MHVLLINGSPHKEGSTYTALHEVETTLNAEGITTQIFHIGNKAVRPCTACGACLHTKRCIFKDDLVNDAIELAIKADGIIVGTPVYYAGANGALCAFLDRLFYCKGTLYAYKPAAAVAVARRGGTCSALDRLNKYFTINNMPVVPSQYWNMVFGMSPEEVRRDREGMQTMRTLGRNMAWLLKCLNIAKGAVPLPKQEEHVSTNFVRPADQLGDFTFNTKKHIDESQS